MQLVRYEAMRTALAEAKDVDEIKDIRDKAEALRLYAKQANDQELESWAAEIKLRAVRRIGELSAALPTIAGARTDLEPSDSTVARSKTQVLADAGINKRAAQRYEKVAAVPEAVFEAFVAAKKAQGRPVRYDDAVKAALKDAKREPGRKVAELRHAGGRVSDLGELAARGVRVGTIYADPPWMYGNQSTRGATGDHYAGLSVDQICALPIAPLAADNAQLHLWTTNAFLFEAYRVMEAWGFEYRSCFVWVKPQIGMGNYWRVSHEFLMLGIRGSATFTDKSLRSWGEYPRSKHSVKPEQIRRLVERASVPGQRLELFARREAPGWLSWGNEIEQSVIDQGEAA